jgi:hypothetical protein
MLLPAIAELETLGYLKPIPAEERFVRMARGEWNAIFIRGSEVEVIEPAEDTPGLAKELTIRGLNRKTAQLLVAQTDEAKIREKIALFDWLVSKSDRRIARSPAGFLYRAISDDFALPDDYRGTLGRNGQSSGRVIELNRRSPGQAVRRPRPTASSSEGLKASEREAIERYWAALPQAEQERIEKELVAKAPPFQREQYLDGQKERGVLFRAFRQAMIDKYVREVLASGAQSGSTLIPNAEPTPSNPSTV